MESYLLKGDVSGIQEFIFNVSSKGAAKSLKAKSYLIQVIGELAYKHALEELNKPEPDKPKLFYDGGGNFFIEFFAETNENAKNEVERIRKKIDSDLLRDEFAISLAYVPLDRKNFGKSWIQLRQASNLEKLRMFQLTPKFFSPYKRSTENIKSNENRVSEEVKERLAKYNFDLDESNALYKAIALEFVKNRRLEYSEFSQTKYKFNYKKELLNKLPLWEEYKKAEKDQYSKYKKFRKAQDELLPEEERTPIKEENIIDFNAFADFAGIRTGTKKIGVVKLDVDNLGQLFGQQENEDVAKNLSEMFREFFNQKLYSLWSEGTFPSTDKREVRYIWNIYPVFAGGDDCFIVGAWDALLYFVSELQEQFKNTFADVRIGNNPITLSAGILIVDCTHPVKDFAERAENALSKAKKKEGKNAVCLFDMVFRWEELSEILKLSKELGTFIIREEMNRSFLDKIRKSAKGFGALQNNPTINLEKIYRLKYYLGRQDDKFKPIIDKLFGPYYDSLKNRLLNKEKVDPFDVAIYPTIARIAELLTRKKIEIKL